MAKTRKVLNKSTQDFEVATMENCPRCKGFGSILRDVGPCPVCNGFGSAWKTPSGWTLAKYKPDSESRLY